jgi:eukaryotic-like serine/threonine-protein kinase
VFAAEVPVDRYRILHKLGAGGMGVVYEAEDTRLNRRVALKFLSPELSRNPAVVAHMEREARAASALNHPNICTIYDIVERDAEIFIVMELLEGQTLGALVGAKPLPAATTIDIARQLAEGLAAAHANGILHHDIKPANVFITANGTAKILDFGLAKAVAPSSASRGADEHAPGAGSGDWAASASAAVMGTPLYMAPERLCGERADARSDLFSLGCVVYEMAAGRRAFDGQGLPAVIESVLTTNPPAASTINPSIPPAVDAVIDKLLQKDPTRRYASAGDVVADLRSLGNDRGRPAARPRRHLVLVTTAALIAATLFGWLGRRGTPVVAAAQHVLIGPFDNRTAEAVFDQTLQRALMIELEQSPYLQTVSEATVRQTLQMMQQPAGRTPAPPLWREVCQRLDAQTLVTGSIAPLGQAYVIAVDAIRCSSGDTVAAEQVQADRRERVLDAVQRAASGLRRRLGEPRRSIENYDQPIEQATTASLEALRFYTAAHDLVDNGDARDAIPLFERAIEIDPMFAIAHARLSTVYRNIEVFDRANAHARRAYELRDRTTQREKLYIEQRYFADVLGDWARLEDAMHVLQHTFPRETTGYINLATLYGAQARLDDAIAETRAAIAVDPRDRLAYDNLTLFLISALRLPEARAILDEQRRRGLETPAWHRRARTIAVLSGDDAAASRELAWLRQHDPEAARGAEQDDALIAGRFRTARKILDERVIVDLARNRSERAALRLGEMAAAEAFAGDTRAAADLCRRALALARTPRTLELVSLPLGLMNTSNARDTLDQARRGLASFSRFMLVWRPIDEAAEAFGRNAPEQALRLLEPVDAFDFGEVASFYAAYLRVAANLRVKNAREAAAGAQQIVNRRGVDPFNPLWVLAHLQQARAAAAVGDAPSAIAGYQRFFTLWRDADADLPILADAQRELKMLRLKAGGQ